ncbi:putative F-box/kelch-repeat protein At1g15680 isoform X1 [Ipomoea triloba]|uniref:putative F-box/kelch-repeat protein At1g15680 isoform X1 n=1 Tax=Ipomoea triloba TaxID=35885 RepID=UPI00125D436C|nr:putative F-box/kelch-repeat protein At1g15680 isoform X1 [Ipomoea triloba]
MAVKSMEISRKFDVLDVGKVVSEGKRSGNLVKLESEVGFRNGYIPEWMLIEILCRLPAKCVFRYKSVSKQLLSLISDPSFVRFYVSRFRENPWTLLSSTLHVDPSGNSNFPKHMLLSAAFSGDENCPTLSAISFPGSPEVSAGQSYNVVAVSDGFVLYAQRVYLECGVTTLTNYTVYSPTTGQCVALPPPSRRFMLSTAGFVTRVEGGALRSFKVVRLGCCLSRCHALELEVFCSESGAWNDAVVRTDHEIEIAWRRTPASFNGNLHWVDRRLGIVAYDPYHAPDRCRIIAFPGGIDEQCNNSIYNGIPSLCVGHQGNLWYLEVLVTSEDDFQFSGFCSWVLGDYEDSNSWSLYQKTKINDISFDENLDIDVLVGFIPVPIAFHPFNPDMIYLGWGDILVSYNMKTRKLEAVDIPNGETLRNGGLKGEPCWWQTSLFVLPTWPTSIAYDPKSEVIY